jgi:hypothetical protein
MVDEAMAYPVVYDQTTKSYSAALYGNRSWNWYYASRPRHNAQISSTYFNDNLFGLSHEVKVGAEYSTKHAEHHWGNGRQFDININYPGPQIDLNGDGTKDVPTGWRYFSYYREGMDNSDVLQYAGYLQDTITKGNFTILLGLRYDLQKPFSGAYKIPTVLKGNSAWNKAVDGTAQDKLAGLLPAISVNEIRPDYKWNTWSPRLGLTWDVMGDGKTIAKVSVAQYGDIMGTGAGLTPPRGLSGTMRFWWKDLNGDKMMSLNELYWLYSGTNAKKFQAYPVFDSSGNFIGDWTDGRSAGMYSGFDPSNPTYVDYTHPTTIYDESAKASSRTREFLVTLEREILPDFAASIDFTYRKYDKFDWWIYDYDPGKQLLDSASWYVQAGTIPATVGGYSTGGAAGKPWYVLKEGYYPTDYTYVKKKNAYNTYWGIDLVLNKRLSNKWFMNASFTLQDQRAYSQDAYYDPLWYADYANPTNKWAYYGKAYALSGGGASGKTAINMYTKWMAKVSAMYQLPFDINISGTFNAREGWRIPHYFWIEDDRLTGLQVGTSVFTQDISQDKLPTFYNFTLRIEKMVKVGDGRLYFMADAFNILNSAIVNRAYDAYLGDYYVDTDTFVPNATNRRLNEILNPRVVRFGVRFEF